MTGIFAFVVLKEGISTTEQKIKEDLKVAVKERIASYAQPDFILVRCLSPFGEGKTVGCQSPWQLQPVRTSQVKC